MRAAAAAVAGVLVGLAVTFSASYNLFGLLFSLAVVGLAVWYLRPAWSQVAVAAAVMFGTTTAMGQLYWSAPVEGFLFGGLYAFGFLVVILIISAVRARQSYLQRGWALAFAEAREQDVRVERAVAREREAMAGEIHDGLGHRLTLIAVQAARLSLDEELPRRVRDEMQGIRANAAAAADELGETVGLLTGRTSEVAGSLNGLGIEDVIERARSSGVTVRGTVGPEVEGAANDYSRAALLRALQEGLTNAAKHAPGAEVHVTAYVDGEEAVLEMRNAVAVAATAPGPSGHGIVALRHRAELLGGILEVEDGEEFAVTLRLPCVSMPSSTGTRPEPSRIAKIADEAAGARRRGRLATRLAWMVPLAGLLVSVLVVIGYFVYFTYASVLPPERFASIGVGDDRDETELVLPREEMLDAPSAVLPEPFGATCRYYEATVSFFERDDVHRICFSDGRVVATDTIPPS